MEIITQFLVAAQYLLWAVVAGSVLAGLALFILGRRRSSRRLAAFGIALAIGPFALPALLNLGQGSAVAQRKAQVAAMQRAAMPADHPRQMAVIGSMEEMDAERLLILGYADQIVLLDHQPRWFSRARQDAACREAAEILDRYRHSFLYLSAARRKQIGATRSLYETCRPSSREEFALASRRIVVRIDGSVTQRASGGSAAPEAVEIALHESGKERIVHYDEMPVLDAPRSPTRLLTQADDYPCDGFDTLQVIANVLDAARRPAEAGALMQRPGDPGRCVVAADPVPAGEEEQARELFRQRQLALLPWGKAGLQLR